MVFFIPSIVALIITKVIFNRKYSWKEFAIHFCVVFFSIIFTFVGGYFSQTYDEKFVNGFVIKKNPVTENCHVGWSDFSDSFCTNEYTREVYTNTTCSGSGKEKTCTRHYKTQYKAVYPWETKYYVETSVGEYEIDRVDNQGAITPNFFVNTSINDPVSKRVSYVNYIKASSQSLFSKTSINHDVEYPDVYSYWKANFVIWNGIDEPVNSKDINFNVMKLNRDISDTGANVIIVFTNNNSNWPDTLASEWDNHNINDIVIVIGTSDNNKIDWVNVKSWSNNDMVNVSIRDHLMNMSSINNSMFDIIKNDVEKYYVLQDMSDFSYLKYDIVPPTWTFVIALLIVFVINPIITYIFIKYDF
jgi:hypothetical protein